MGTADQAIESPDPERRKLLAGATAAAGGLALAGASAPFLASLTPSERAKASGAPVETDIGSLTPGQLRTLEWRGKPVWILRRTPEMLASLKALRGVLIDPDSEVASQQPEYARNPARSVRDELYVSIALCTHLGCIPGYYPEPGSIQSDRPGGSTAPATDRNSISPVASTKARRPPPISLCRPTVSRAIRESS